jgi:phosphotransferase system HPr-like phosphotransfer protein
MSAKNAMILLPSELKAVEEHKYYMSLTRGEPVSIDEAIGDFVQSYRGRWLQEKQQQDTREQVREIEKHKWYRSEEAGYDVGRSTASQEWISRFADTWRQASESLEANGFRAARLAVDNGEGVRAEAGQRLTEIALSWDCDIYIHWTGMDCYSFIMRGEAFLDAKSPCFLRQFEAATGEDVEVIATGAKAEEAIEEIKALRL